MKNDKVSVVIFVLSSCAIACNGGGVGDVKDSLMDTGGSNGQGTTSSGHDTETKTEEAGTDNDSDSQVREDTDIDESTVDTVSITDDESASDTASQADTDSEELDTNVSPGDIFWVELPSGKFLQGNESSLSIFHNETPAHEVTIGYSFEMMRNEVTVAQYKRCVEAKACEAPENVGDNCNYFLEGKGDHPVNCLTIYSAIEYCAWIEARLPSESEWEYAARSAGKENTFPWGEEIPSCELAVLLEAEDDAVPGCGENGTMPVCSKMKGNTEQGLCDMAGNVREFVPDSYRNDYKGAPVDGTVWGEMGDGASKVLRGGYYGSFGGEMDGPLRTRARFYMRPTGKGEKIGFRCAKKLK